MAYNHGISAATKKWRYRCSIYFVCLGSLINQKNSKIIGYDVNG